MKLALLITSTAALALATPIIPTMVYDLPSVATPTDNPPLPDATITYNPIPPPDDPLHPPDYPLHPPDYPFDPPELPPPGIPPPWHPHQYPPEDYCEKYPWMICNTVAKFKEWKEKLGM
jgi:hypothetical protein